MQKEISSSRNKRKTNPTVLKRKILFTEKWNLSYTLFFHLMCGKLLFIGGDKDKWQGYQDQDQKSP